MPFENFNEIIKRSRERSIWDNNYSKLFTRGTSLPTTKPESTDEVEDFALPQRRTLDKGKLSGMVLQPMTISEDAKLETTLPTQQRIDSQRVKGESLPEVDTPIQEEESVSLPQKSEISPQQESLSGVSVPTQEEEAEPIKQPVLDTEVRSQLGMPSAMGSGFYGLGEEQVLEQSKKTYDCIVDSAGYGDYTSLYDAIQAGHTTIFIRNGNYEEKNSITPLDNTTITGESRTGTIIDFGNNTINLSARYVSFSNLTLYSESDTHFITFGVDTSPYETEYSLDNVYLYWHTITPTTYAITATGYYGILRITNSYIDVPNISSAWGIHLNGKGSIIANNLTFLGQGSLAKAFYLSPYSYGIGQLTNIFIRGVFNSTVSAKIVGTTLSNLMNYTSRVQPFNFILHVDDVCTISGIIGIDILLTGHNSSLSNLYVGDFEITGNYTLNRISNARITDLTLGASTKYNILDSITITDTFTDNSGKNKLSKVSRGATLVEMDFAYIKNTSGGNLVAGNLVVLKAVAAGNEFTTTTSQGDDLVFGVLAEDIDDTDSGYVQTIGKTTLLKVDGTTDIAIGDFIGTSTTAGIGMKAGAGDMAVAISLEVYTTDDANGIIDALLITPRKI